MLNFKLSGNTFAPHANRLYEKTSIINVSKTGRIISAAAGTALYVLSVTGKKGIINTLWRYGGLYLIYRGISGNCPVSAAMNEDEVIEHASAINIRTSLIVNAPRQFLYDTWRDLEKLPRFLTHIKNIKVTDDIHSRWTMKTPGNVPSIAWNAEIIDQQDGKELSWRSLPGSMVETAGKITFADAPNATELNINISYRPPAGYIGAAIGGLMNSTLKKFVEEDIQKFKKYAERKASKL